MVSVVTAVVAALFLAVAALLAYGARAFSRAGHTEGPSRVSMGREVVWTGLASLLLLGIFLYAHP
jgi:predicted secreted protein